MSYEHPYICIELKGIEYCICEHILTKDITILKFFYLKHCILCVYLFMWSWIKYLLIDYGICLICRDITPLLGPVISWFYPTPSGLIKNSVLGLLGYQKFQPLLFDLTPTSTYQHHLAPNIQAPQQYIFLSRCNRTPPHSAQFELCTNLVLTPWFHHKSSPLWWEEKSKKICVYI